MDVQLAERAFQLAWQHYDNIGQVSVRGKKTELAFPDQCVIEKYEFCHVAYCGGSDFFDTFSPFYKAWFSGKQHLCIILKAIFTPENFKPSLGSTSFYHSIQHFTENEQYLQMVWRKEFEEQQTRLLKKLSSQQKPAEQEETGSSQEDMGSWYQEQNGVCDIDDAQVILANATQGKTKTWFIENNLYCTQASLKAVCRFSGLLRAEELALFYFYVLKSCDKDITEEVAKAAFMQMYQVADIINKNQSVEWECILKLFSKNPDAFTPDNLIDEHNTLVKSKLISIVLINFLFQCWSVYLLSFMLIYLCVPEQNLLFQSAFKTNMLFCPLYPLLLTTMVLIFGDKIGMYGDPQLKNQFIYRQANGFFASALPSKEILLNGKYNFDCFFWEYPGYLNNFGWCIRQWWQYPSGRP